MEFAAYLVDSDRSYGCHVTFLKRYTKLKHVQLEGITTTVVQVHTADKQSLLLLWTASSIIRIMILAE